MTDAELLRVASNRTSFIEVAQTILADELVKRNLVAPLAVPVDAAVQVELTPSMPLALRLAQTAST